MKDFPEQYDPDFPYPPMFDKTDPEFDTDWDYAEIWGRVVMIQGIAGNVEIFLQMDATEYRSPAVDQTIREHLRQINAQSKAIMAMLD